MSENTAVLQSGVPDLSKVPLAALASTGGRRPGLRAVIDERDAGVPVAAFTSSIG